MSPLHLDLASARGFMCRATGLESGLAGVGEALDHLGFVQIDPINVCGRMHDLILRTRVRGYREHDLMRHLHQSATRTAFEHHLPDSHNLAALPLDAWPYLQRGMTARARSDSLWSGKLTVAERRLAASLLARMMDEGPLCSQDIKSGRKAKRHEWDSTTLAKSTLQKLFFHGRVLIARREGTRRHYDLPEKVLPASILGLETPSEANTALWLARLKLRQRRLVALKAAERRLLEDEVISVRIPGLPKPDLFLLAEDIPGLDVATSGGEPTLIAPLDPVIYDRKVTAGLWHSDYRWEVYVPPQKRVRGYYALPLLHRNELGGYADLKADREAGVLNVISHQGRNVMRGAKRLAGFLGLGKLNAGG
jgi:uncharacterized protein